MEEQHEDERQRPHSVEGRLPFHRHGYRSSLRQIGAGAKRRMPNTACRIDGAHTTELPLRRPLATAVATTSTSAANGASATPAVIFERMKPGPHHHHLGTRAVQRMPEPGGERILGRLGRSVDEVRRPRPNAGDARQHDERAVALGAELPRDGESRADGTDVVHLGERRSGHGIVVRRVVAELSEGLDHDVEVTVRVGDRSHERVVAGVIEGVEFDGHDRDRCRRAAWTARSACGGRRAPPSSTPARRVRARSPGRCRCRPRARGWSVAAAWRCSRWSCRSVRGFRSSRVQMSSRRRAWSLAQRPSGSNRERTAFHSSSRG